jgi:hypothetical protein
MSSRHYTQHFFVENHYFGSVKRGEVRTHEQMTAPRSYAYFCPICAEVWARCPVEHVGAAAGTFRCIETPCRKHTKHAWAVPGSLMLLWDKEFSEILPDELVQWEFECHLNYAENILLTD